MNDKEWDVFKESVRPIKKDGTTKTILKNITPRITSKQTTITTDDLETVYLRMGELRKEYS